MEGIIISRSTDLFHKIATDWNCLSSSSKFYYYHDKLYEWCRYSYTLSLVEDIEKIKRASNKIKNFVAHKKYKEIGFIKWMAEATLRSELVNKGAYKFRVPEYCSLHKIKTESYDTMEDFFDFCFFKIESIFDYKEKIKDSWRDFLVLPVYEPRLDRIGFFVDVGTRSLGLYGCTIHLIDYGIYKGYMDKNNEKINVPVRDKILQGNLFKE